MKIKCRKILGINHLAQRIQRKTKGYNISMMVSQELISGEEKMGNLKVWECFKAFQVK